MATMLFGVMAGQLIRSTQTPRRKLGILILAGLICFVASMGIDTTIWPVHFDKLTYSYAPIVKRIWTPSWAVFSAGWTFWFLALFYWVVDMRGHRWLGLPLAIVGMNSIVVYCINELIGNEAGGADAWLPKMLKIHLTAFDAAAHTALVKIFYGPGTGAPLYRHLAVLALVWLICLWLYRRRLFVRI